MLKKQQQQKPTATKKTKQNKTNKRGKKNLKKLKHSTKNHIIIHLRLYPYWCLRDVNCTEQLGPISLLVLPVNFPRSAENASVGTGWLQAINNADNAYSYSSTSFSVRPRVKFLKAASHWMKAGSIWSCWCRSVSCFSSGVWKPNCLRMAKTEWN